MTDKDEDYYQPWLRDPAPGPGKKADNARPHGLAKPPESPPLGVDLNAYPADDAPKPRTGADPAAPHADGRAALTRLRDGARSFAAWTIKTGERADIPARVERLELPRRTHSLAKGGAAATARAGKLIGKGAASGWSALSASTARGWQRLALPDQIGRIAGSAKSGVEAAADKTRSTVGKAAKAGIAGVSEATGRAKGKLKGNAKAPAAPPPSGLDQLMERETAQQPRKSTPDLPLFAADALPPAQDASAPAPKKVRAASPQMASVPPPASPGDVPPSRPVPPQATGSSNWPSRRALPWWVAGAALALALMFWLGSRSVSHGEIETVVADYIMTHPEIIPQAMDQYRANETAKAIGAIRPALEKTYAGAWAGNPHGDVTIVEFTDYGCVFCRASVPDVDRLLREDEGVKIVYRELPIIAPQSRDAAMMALRAARQGKYDAFHHAMFAAASLESSAIAAAAAKAGLVTDGSADATGSAAMLQRELDSNLAMAQQLQLNATPTWIIGDQLLQGALGYDGLTAAIAKARAAKG